MRSTKDIYDNFDEESQVLTVIDDFSESVDNFSAAHFQQLFFRMFAFDAFWCLSCSSLCLFFNFSANWLGLSQPNLASVSFVVMNGHWSLISRSN